MNVFNEHPFKSAVRLWGTMRNGRVGMMADLARRLDVTGRRIRRTRGTGATGATKTLVAIANTP